MLMGPQQDNINHSSRYLSNCLVSRRRNLLENKEVQKINNNNKVMKIINNRICIKIQLKIEADH